MKQDAAEGDEMDLPESDYPDVDARRMPVLNGINKEISGLWSKNTTKTNGEQQRPTAEPASPVVAGKSKKRPNNDEHPAKRRKAAPGVDRSPPTHVSCLDLGGVGEIVRKLKKLMVLPLLRPEVYINSDIQPPRGILLHGPPGCGKTMIAHAMAAELQVPFIAISAPSIVSGMSGESEKALREYFDEAKRLAPCLMFIDEIDSITPKRESAQREMEKRIVAQLLTCMDDLALEKSGRKAVMVLAATNRPDSLDPALRRAGRFDREINLGVPNEAVREQILRAMTRGMRVSQDFAFRDLAKKTPGFVGADLKDLVSTAGAAAIERFLDTLETDDKAMEIADSNEMEVDNQTILPQEVKELRQLVQKTKEPSWWSDSGIHITIDDFEDALPEIQPSAKREGFATIPETTWAQIGALGPVREELLMAIVDPIKNPEMYESEGITAPSGVLLWGPPGCGKTLLAKAVANESKANFISVKGPELLNKYVGESEKAVLKVFERARSSVPCVIFFDELDALVPKRDDSLSESSARVVNTMLTELDGLSNRHGIYVIAATNRPDRIDPAMLRPGRLETLLFVDLPGEPERVDIMRTLCRNSKKTKFTPEIGEIAGKCDRFSGADLEKLLKEAVHAAIRRKKKRQGSMSEGAFYEDFKTAREKVGPSVSDSRKYDRLKAQWGTGV